jgi:hypothetical protein
MNMKQWVKENLFQSKGMWIFYIGLIALTLLITFSKINGDVFVAGLSVLAGIAVGSNKLGDLITAKSTSVEGK